MGWPLGSLRSFGCIALRCLLSAALLFAAAASATTKKPPPRPVNLNSATSAELQQVPGIGPATADKILQMRKTYGQFKTVDDLLAVRGIGKKRLDKMRKYLTVGKPPSSRPAATNHQPQPAKCPGCAKPAPTAAGKPVAAAAKPAPPRESNPPDGEDEEPE
jgi:competence protein ComEA